MLKKLMKYDLRWIYKLMIVFYIAAVLFSVIGRGLAEIQNSTIFSILSQICIGIAIAMVVNCLINNLMRLWVRFVRNFYKDESYLTHTLPVSKKSIYLSKIFSGIFSIFVTVLLIVVCLAICFYSKETMEILKNALQIMANNYETTVLSFLTTLCLVFFLQMVFALLSGYLGIIVGHKSNNNKMAKSIMYGFLFYIIPQVLTVFLLFVIGAFNQEIMKLFTTNNSIPVNVIKTIMGCGIGIYLIYNMIYYWVGKKQFEKGVNVD